MAREVTFRLLLIARADQLPQVAAALAALPPGAAAVQLRDRSLPCRALLQAAGQARALFAGRARLLVNDRLDVAQAAGADGVHLPARGVTVEEARSLLGPAALVGQSCHGEAELSAATDADFVLLSPVWATPGKGPPLGLTAFARLAAPCPRPVFALGGVDAGRAAQARAAGAFGVAAIRSVLEAAAPARAAADLWEAVRPR